MGNTCSFIRHMEVVVSGFRKGGLLEAAHDEISVPGLAGDGGSSSGGAHLQRDGKESFEHSTCSGKVRSDVEERIENSKSCWSELMEQESDDDNDEMVVQENRKVFEELQAHPSYGSFFRTFGDDANDNLSTGELVVGEKFAEGGQADLYHAKIILKYPGNADDLEWGNEWVLKVFKANYSLRNLYLKVPNGYLQWYAQDEKRYEANLPPETQYRNVALCGTLLKDGRFAFLLEKEHEDLRTRIDVAMLNIGNGQGPFPKDEVERIMLHTAQGMDWLHGHNIVHRDLKAANVLVSLREGNNPIYYVADWECSVGVIGAAFFRAPEILQALKDRVMNVYNSTIFSKEADVYSYGMTCYEVLTGKIPFHDRLLNDYDVVLNGQRPSIPEHIESWMKELLNRCWDVDCSKRPSFEEILKILSSNSDVVRKDQLEQLEEIKAFNKKHEERFL